MQTRNVISGIVGILFGGFILLSSLSRGGPQGEGAYRTGQWIGLLIGLLMLVAGVYYLWKAYADSTPKRPQKKVVTKPPAAPIKRQPPPPPGASGLPPRQGGR